MKKSLLCYRLLTSAESLDFSEFSNSTRLKLEELSNEACGGVNVVFDDGVSSVDVLGFVGRQRVQLDATEHQRYHASLIVGLKKMI